MTHTFRIDNGWRRLVVTDDGKEEWFEIYKSLHGWIKESRDDFSFVMKQYKTRFKKRMINYKNYNDQAPGEKEEKPRKWREFMDGDVLKRQRTFKDQLQVQHYLLGKWVPKSSTPEKKGESFWPKDLLDGLDGKKDACDGSYDAWIEKSNERERKRIMEETDRNVWKTVINK